MCQMRAAARSLRDSALRGCRDYGEAVGLAVARLRPTLRAHQPCIVAQSITKRYFTSLLTMRS